MFLLSPHSNIFMYADNNRISTNTSITGPQDLEFICKNVLVPAGGSYNKIGTFEIVSSSVVGTSKIINSVTNVIPVDSTKQIFLTVSNVPISANVDIQLTPICTKPCS